MKRSGLSAEEEPHEEGPQCGGVATVTRLATVRRRSHSESISNRESIGQRGGATVRRSGLSAEEEPQ